MSTAEHMDVSPSQVNGQAENHSCLKQTTEQTCEFGADSLHSEPLELKYALGSEAVQNGSREPGTAVTSGVINEKLQSSCGDDDSSNDHLKLPLEDASKSSQTNNISWSQQNTAVPKHEDSTESIHSEQSEQKHQLDSKIILKEPGETSTGMCISADDEKMCSFSEDMTKSSITEHVRPSSEGVSKNSLSDIEQTLEFSSGHAGNELDSQCVHSEPSQQENQLGSEMVRVDPADTDAVVLNGSVKDNLQPFSEEVIKICVTEPLQSPKEDVIKSSQTSENLCPQQPISDQTLEFTGGITRNETLEVNHKVGSELVQDKPVDTSTEISCCIAVGQLEPSSELVSKSSPIEHLKPSPEGSIRTPSAEHLIPSSDNMVRNSNFEDSETPYAVKDSSSMECRGKNTSKSIQKKSMSRSLIGSERVLRTRSQEKPNTPQSSNNLANVTSGGEKKRKKKNKKSSGKMIVTDEYSRIRKHLRYLLNRISYEQNLIDAYSGEGWKGQSVEKLKPEKELQRATSEILRRKLKIRDLFQHLDSLCAEGKLPIDSEGEVDSEDIFCAKCGSRDLPADNDIILCDGACDRGFHQYCVEPPLLKEDIPPDDEGWLCPACDCKVDCLDLVNDSHGTKLCVTDSWEKVFPEARAAGDNHDPNFGLPSDDSDDNDYDPDGPATDDEKDQGDESSSDESEYASASEGLEASANNKEHTGLSSDDSEDDDFNPDAPELDENVAQESSSSDFTSDSEDLDAVLPSGNDENTTSGGLPKDSNGQRSKFGGNKDSLKNELLSILESGKDGAGPVYERRGIERLDYKKLYDETYGNAPSDSSDDDEDWVDNAASSKRMKNTGKGSPMSPNGNAPLVISGKNKKDIKQNQKETEHTPKKRTRQKLNSDDTNTLPAKSLEGSSTPLSGKGAKSSNKKDTKQNQKETEHTPERRTRRKLNSEDTSTLPAKSRGGSSTPASTGKGAKSFNKKDIKQNQEETEHTPKRRTPRKLNLEDTSKPAKSREDPSTPGSTGKGAKSSNKKDIKQNQETEHTPNRRTPRKLKSEGTSTLPTKSREGLSTPGSSGKGGKSSKKKLGEDVTQGLHKSFKVNQYPDRTAKENLAKELGITVQQVTKWFENARWSFKHSASMTAKMGKIDPKKGTSSPQSNKLLGRGKVARATTENVEPSEVGTDVTEGSSRDVKARKSATRKSTRQKSTAQASRKRKRKN